MLAVDKNQAALCRKWAKLYQSKGWSVLPCKIGEKRPAVRYADYFDNPAPTDLIDRIPCTAFQVILGRRAGLLVLDLDGPEAKAWWSREHAGRCPRTWASHSGGGGLHLWFRVRHDGPRLAKRILWTDGGKHSAVERLGDGSLIVAPPSRHSEGRTYQFVDKARSPISMPMPAWAPAWLLALPAHDADKRPARPVYDANWLDRVGDKIRHAQQWGVRFTGRANRDWHECHAIDRDDQHPSAAVHSQTGHYRDLGPSDQSLRFLDLAVALGAYPDWRTAADDLRNQYGVRQ